MAAVLLCCLLLCLPLSAQRLPEIPEPLQLTTDEERADAIFLEGVRQELAGHYSEAYELFNHALMLRPQSVGALYELSLYARHMQQDSLSTSLLEQAARLDSDNFWLKQALVQLYVGQHRQEDAIRQLESMTSQYPRRSDLLFMLADMYQRTENYEALVRTIDRIELLEGKSEQLSMDKFRAYVGMKDEERAFAEMQALADEYPNDVRYCVLLGDVYLNNDKTDEAFAVYSRLLEEYPDNMNVQLSLANYYDHTDQDSLAQEMLGRAIVNDQLDEQVRLQLMQSIAFDNVQHRGDTTDVMRLFRRLLARPQADTGMTELAARYMITREVPTEQVKPVLRQMLDIDPEAELARNQLLGYAIQEEDTSEIVRLCKTAVDYGSDDPVYYYYLAIGYFQQNRNQAAIDAAKRGLPKADPSKNLLLVTNLYAILGDLYHRTGQNTLAFEAYDSCLIYRPDDALVLNNYAYYLSLEKRDLRRAEQMSLKSLEQEGANPTYLDTYAWILFQQKRYDEAKVYIDSVLVLLGDHVTSDDVSLVEHAGDIYSKCGHVEQAVQFWQQALDLGGPNALIEKKIRKRKYLEK